MQNLSKLCLLFAFILPYSAFSAAPKDPVVLLHGWGMSGLGTMDGIKRYLISKGWNEKKIHIIDLSSTLQCIEQSAAELGDFIDEVLQKESAEKVDLVAHSMGGVISRYYIKFLGGEFKVNDMVTLAASNHGTLKSYVAAYGCSSRQTIPGSRFLRELNSPDETHGDVRYTAIRALADLIILPNSSSKLEGARNANVLAGHFTVLTSSRTRKLIVEGLNGAGLNDN